MGKIGTKLKSLLGLNNKSVGASVSILLFLIVFQISLFPSFSQAQFGLGAFWKKYVVAGGNPPNPSGLGATPANFSVDISWTSGGGSTATFRIAWAKDGTAPADCNTATTSDIVTGIAASPYTVSGLLEGTQYSFRVCAADASGNLSSGVTISSTTTTTSRYIFTTNLTYKGNVIPSCSSLATTAGLPNAANYQTFLNGGANWTTTYVSGRIKLPIKNRRPVGSGGPEVVANIQFQRQLLASIGYSQTDVAVAGNAWTGTHTDGYGNAPATTCTSWTSAAGGQTGSIGLGTDTASATWFSVGANTCGTATRVICYDTTDGGIPPADPTNLTFTPSSGTAGTLSWTSPIIETSGFDIKYQTGSAPADCTASGIPAQTATTYNMTGLTAGTTYYARVCSRDDEDVLVSNGKVLTFTTPLSTILWLGSLSTSGISSTGFTANVDFSGDSDNDFSATLYYCNATLNAGCNPQNTGTGYGSASMSKSGNYLTATVSGLAPATWNEYDVLNIRVVATDPDTAYGSPLNGTVTLINVIQPPATFAQKIKTKAADLSGNYPYTWTTIDPDLFGMRIAKVGRVMIIGTVQDDNSTSTISTTADSNDTAVDSGAVWILRDTSGGADWTSYAIDKFLKEATPISNVIFGKGIAFDGTTLAVGGPTQSGAASGQGRVKVYREGTVNGNWSDVTLKHTITDPKYNATSDCFGCTLAIAGRNLFVGDQFDDAADETPGTDSNTSVDSGAVFVYYDATGDGTGYPASTPDKKLKQRTDAGALDVIASGSFGTSISYSGSSLVVGAPGKASPTIVGKATVYSCKITASGNPCGTTINWSAGTNTISSKVLTTTSPMNVPDTFAGGFYGFSVSIDDDTVVVGAPADQTTTETDNTGATATVGGAYVWHSTNGNADWSAISMVKKLKMRDGTGAVAPTTAYQFGTGVAVLGPVVAVGASRGATQQVNVFKDSDGDANFSTGSVTHHQRIQNATQPDRFGEYVVLDNSLGYFQLVISAHNESSQDPTNDTNPAASPGLNSGAAYVYGP